MLMMSTGRSTMQTSEASRRGSAQIAQGIFSVSAPQTSQNRTRSRALRMVSASCLTAPDSACTRCKAMRSAERGPMPGSLLSAPISAAMGSGRMDMWGRET